MRTSDGLQLNVVVTGEGPPIVLLHGFPDSLRMWDGVAERLAAAGRRVIRVDQRGFGASDAPEGIAPYRMPRLVKDIAEVLDVHAPGEAVDVVGHDWGAVVSWTFCATHPERARRHVAISVGHFSAYRTTGPEQLIRGSYILFFQLRGFAERTLLQNDASRFRRFARRHPALDAAVADMQRPGRLTAGLAWYRANLPLFWGRHKPCPVPTLGIHSDGDPYWPRLR